MMVRAQQREKLRRLLAAVAPANAFYRSRPAGAISTASLEAFTATCPLLTKAELIADREAHPPYGANLTYPLERYTRWNLTSGTSGRPLPWLDTPEDWRAMLAGWHRVYAAAGVEPGVDRIFFAFTFEPFLGFWTAYEAALSLHVMALPGGGLSTRARLRAVQENAVTVLCCTPTYALRLGEARTEEGADCAVRLIIVAGEPGGGIPATRARIERLWPGAVVFDHYGLTEAGPVGHEEPGQPGWLRVMEGSHFAEILSPVTLREVAEGEEGELVLTTLDRLGCPLLRYRTGDIVRKARAADGGLCLAGGILGRTDDMVVVQGVNVYPSSIERILRRFPKVVEYQVREDRQEGVLNLHLVIELEPGTPERLAHVIQHALHDTLALRLPVEVFPPGSLPRFEFKSRRWVKAPVE